MNEKYEKILNLPHKVSEKHPRMSRRERAAQFAPYSALSGYEEAVYETARYTEKQISLDEGEIEKINMTLTSLSAATTDTTVKICFFRPDIRKKGGEYVTVHGIIGKIDAHKREITLIGEGPISFENIIEISYANVEN